MLSFISATFLVAACVSAAPLSSRQDACDIAACGIALGPTGVGCVGAAVKLGADPFADAGCAAGVANLGVNTPAPCVPCVAAIGDLIPEPVKEAADTATDAVGETFDSFKDGVAGLFSRQDETCDIAKCGIALGPTGVGCVGAAVKLGADPFADAGCVAGVTNLGVNTPAPCVPCFAAVSDLIPEPIKEAADTATDAVGDAFDDVKDGISGLFSRQDETCDIAKCGIALGPTGVGCVGAAVKLGADPFADAGCVAGVANLGVNTPAPCVPCFAAVTDLIPEPVKEAADTATDAVGDAFDDVKDGISGLFSREY